MAGDTPERDIPRRPPTPRWVKAIAIVALLIFILVLVVGLLGGMSHGPGMHGG
ncbi:MAG: hypothetical protein H0V73_12965 [Chloroflexi bacterium]|nr:hypothetical protein [Chloroflexota bacterium]